MFGLSTFNQNYWQPKFKVNLIKAFGIHFLFLSLKINKKQFRFIYSLNLGVWEIFKNFILIRIYIIALICLIGILIYLLCILREQGQNLGLPLQHRHQDDAEALALTRVATQLPINITKKSNSDIHQKYTLIHSQCCI